MLRIKITTAFLLSLSLLLVVNTRAQDSEIAVKMKDLPQAVQKTVREQSQGATIRGFAKEMKDGQTFYEVELRVKGHSKDVLMDPSGAVVEVEEEIALASLPPVVKTAIEKHAGRGKILLVESITKNASVEAYEAQIKSGRKISEVKLSSDGQLISIENDGDEAKEKAARQKCSTKTKKP
jgi:uncharacterized membrane protein YkoI